MIENKQSCFNLQNAFQMAYFLWSLVSNFSELHSVYMIIYSKLRPPKFVNNLTREMLLLLMQFEFGITSCVHDNIYSIALRVCLGVILHVLCSYITFPHYALVTQVSITPLISSRKIKTSCN